MCIYVFACTCMHVCHMCVYAQKSQKKIPDPLEPKLQALVSCLAWVLGTELEFSGRVGSMSC